MLGILIWLIFFGFIIDIDIRKCKYIYIKKFKNIKLIVKISNGD